MMQVTKEKIDHRLVQYIFPVGLFIQLSGIIWLGKKFVLYSYIGLIIPALVSILLNFKPQQIFAFKRKFDWNGISFMWIFLALFLLWVALSSSWSDTPKTFLRVAKFCTSILLYVYVIARLGENPRKLLMIFLISAVVMAMGAATSLVYHYVIQGEPLGWREYRIRDLTHYYANFGHPIGAALNNGIFGIIIFSMLSFREQMSKLLFIGCYVCFLILSMYVIMTWSRGPWIAYIVSICLILLTGKNKFLCLVTIIFSSMCIMWLFYHHNIVRDKILDSTFSGRTNIWMEDIHTILHKPWFGYGYNSYFEVKNNFGQKVYNPHSYYFQVLRSYGIVGAILFFGMLISAAYLCVKHRHQKLVNMAGYILVCSSIGMLTDVPILITHIHYCWLYLWLPLGLLATLSSRNPIKTGDEKLNIVNVS